MIMQAEIFTSFVINHVMTYLLHQYVHSYTNRIQLFSLMY